MLFDQNAPRKLRALLKPLGDFQMKTADEMGWGRISNGQLLQLAEEAGFHVLLTADKNISYQQNPRDRRIAIVLLETGQWPRVRLHYREIAAVLNRSEPGAFIEVAIPSR